ncbi:PREDICTED: mannosyl-oligosaccharide 1,2-alpha-mannosidase IB-like, partial [Priapulus caudatus]|uniref:Mannosyl-oligosaccharide 1,2-alpha-mannosidase IB-like n=1 Tax=Priapulus caudatus TaxID=37621 RepID=A0ABM1F3Q0_PRICU
MASGAIYSILPTHQRYVNGVPIPQTRKTLRLREKYVVLMVFVTFVTVCFGAFFFLPELRGRVQKDGPDLLLPKRGAIPGIISHDDADVADVHKIMDKANLNAKIEFELARDKLRDQLGHRAEDAAVVAKPAATERPPAPAPPARPNTPTPDARQVAPPEQTDPPAAAAAVVVPAQPGPLVLGSQKFGEPADEATKLRRDTVRE